MRQTFSIKEKINSLVMVLLPIIITQLSLVSTGFFDTVMAGNVSGIALAGVAIGVNLWMPILNGSIGIISGLTPIISQLYGAKEEEKIINVVIQGLYVATILTVLIIIGQIFVVDSIIASMNLEYEVEHTAKGFLQAISCGILPLFFAIVMRNFIDSLGKTRVTMLITILAVPFNILMNYLFIFGKCGFPELGGIGAGVGSAITYWFMAIMNIVVLLKLKPFTDYLKYQKHYKPNIQLWKEQIKIGLPIGIAIFCEVSIFAAVALFMAEYGTAVIAAHQAAITFAALVYMIPISISMALTIIIGFEVGAKRFKDAVEYTYLGIGIAVFFSVIFGLIFYAFNENIALLYTKEIAVFNLIKTFLIYAIFFQLSDAINAPIQGALRGYKDVNITLIMAIISYWIVGLPVGYILAKLCNFGPYGYWLGLIGGLAVSAVALSFRLKLIQKQKAGW